MNTTDKTFSFELFPPKTEKGIANLRQTVTTLNHRNPAFFSVTYGAGGSTQSNTFATVDWISEQNIAVAPHLSCIGSTRDELIAILDRYAAQGIHRIVALRGDLPSGAGAGSIRRPEVSKPNAESKSARMASVPPAKVTIKAEVIKL